LVIYVAVFHQKTNPFVQRVKPRTTSAGTEENQIKTQTRCTKHATTTAKRFRKIELGGEEGE